MSDPIQDFQHVKKGLGRLLSQFKGQPNFAAILSSYLVQVQELEDMFFGLLIGRRLDDAVGVQLDGIGDTIDLARGGLNDDDYRTALRGQVATLKLNGKIEDILFVFNLLEPGFTFQLSETGNANFILRFVEAFAPSAATLAVLTAQLRKTKGGGVGFELHWSENPDSDTFKTADGVVLQADANQGTADPGMTFGGHLSGAVG